MTILRTLFLAANTAVVYGVGVRDGAGSSWTRIGPWNIFNGVDPTKSYGMGEAGTLASAASPAANPNLIYAGGQNNGASSGVLKTVDGGIHWTRQSRGMWDTRVLGVWLHPDDPQGSHVLAGTHSGIYESMDSAETWELCNETADWGPVMSFREAIITDDKYNYIVANGGNGWIFTRPQAGGKWQKIKAPGGMAPNMYLSVVISAGKTELLTCIGGWGGGKLYYGTLDSPTEITWTDPISSIFNGTTALINCANAAVDPNDRNHFIYSQAGEYHMRHSEDGGKTVAEYPHIDSRGQGFATYFVMIDQKGWLYAATQSGAFVSEDKGVTWHAYHVMIAMRSGEEMDRVPHDYQNIVPNFRGDGIAFPSDQGLHIVDHDSPNYTLTSAIGDMRNAISLSAIISPSADGKSRNIVSNIWDWDVAVSWDDGAQWDSWNATEKSPMACGEGGGGQGMGNSPHQIMFHHSNWWASSDGGHNFIQGKTPGSPGGGFDYVRQAGSRIQPSGVYFAMLSAPADYDGSSDGARASTVGAEAREYPKTYKNHADKNLHAAEKKRLFNAGRYNDKGDGFLVDKHNNLRDADADATNPPPPSPPVNWLMTSTDFGATFSWTKMPANLKTDGFSVDPTSTNSLYTVGPECLSHSVDNGKSWSPCSTATGLTGSFVKLIVKDSSTMFMLRSGAVPLRTKNGGKTWTELASALSLFAHGATLEGSLSWTGKTLVLHGTDRSAIGRGTYGTNVWKSVDDGETWADETGDLVTISLGGAAWYETDFYITSAGEGILVKRGFE